MGLLEVSCCCSERKGKQERRSEKKPDARVLSITDKHGGRARAQQTSKSDNWTESYLGKGLDACK